MPYKLRCWVKTKSISPDGVSKTKNGWCWILSGKIFVLFAFSCYVGIYSPNKLAQEESEMVFIFSARLEDPYFPLTIGEIVWGIQIWLLELSTTNALPRLLQISKMASRIFKLQKKIWLFSILWVKKTFWKHCLWAKIVLLSFSNDNWHQPFLLETPMGQVKLQRNTDFCSTLWSKKYSGNTPHESKCFYWASPPKTDTTCSSWRPL